MMSKIIILLVSTLLLPSANCNTCASVPNGVNRFGPHCGFMCHCKNNEECDVISGECPSGCASMWYGPGCQYRDMAEGEFSRHSDNMKPHNWPNLANDGNLRTCSYTAEVNSTEKKTSPFWRVWLPTQETIRELMIVTKVEALENFTNFSVYVENVSENEKTNNYFVPSDRQECYKHDNVAPKNETMIVLCKTPVAGNQVRIELAALQTQLILCDVRINGGRNLAFGRETFQSSTISYCKQHKPDGCTASKAVDGVDSPSNWQECSYTSGEQNSWWKLDIGHQSHIWYARISPFSGVDLPQLRLDVSSTANGTWKTVKDKTSDQLQVNNSLNTVARYVKLTNTEHPWWIRLCEIKIFGDCQSGHCGFDCTKKCHCRKTNIWDKIAGICSSGSGKRKLWGSAYEHKCGHCLNAAPCDESTGECPLGCQEGYIPPKCNMECRDGQYGTNCSFTCNGYCKKNVCDRRDGHCAHGCWGGYSGPKCDQECQTGTDDRNCTEACSRHCKKDKNDIRCNKTDGHCLHGCKNGYIGDKCDQMCKLGTYGQKCKDTCGHCYGGNYACNVRNGTCSEGCNPGWTNDNCNKDCIDGKYGNNCSKPCPNNCANGPVCNKVNGSCDDGCKPGFVGTQCEQNCTDGRYGKSCSEHCPNNCAIGTVCNKVNGSCNDGCKPGFFGTQCDQNCTDGNYGRNCSNPCPKNCADGTVCNKVNGDCDDGCKPGFFGIQCQKNCTDGRYGKSCAEHCPNNCAIGTVCNKVNGSCDDGCNPGFSGTQCEQSCSDGKYGRNCSNPCPKECANGTVCNKINGDCDDGCKPGFFGTQCQKKCPDGYFGNPCNEKCSMNCLGGFSNCDKVYGSCISGCLPGWQGRQCSEACSSGYWGKTCVNVCGHCYFGTCRSTDGVCESKCANGYKQTPHCDKDCENGTYGFNCTNTCSKNCKDMCNKRTGSCSQCTSGWHGDQCTIPCVVGSWGENCRRKCHTCLNKVCDRVTGACLGNCKAGFRQTQFCDQECSDGWYGLNCTNKCSRNCKNESHCRKTDGSCLECKPGWHGILCENDIIDKTDTSTVIAGTLAGAVLLLIAGIITKACMRKRKTESSSRNMGSKSIADTTISFTNVQEPPDVAAAEIMESTYETIRASSENEHEYEVSTNQSS